MAVVDDFHHRGAWSILLNALVKEAMHRPRPHFSDLLLTLTTYSFPSGHSASATLFYGFLATYVIVRLRAWRSRLMVGFIALSAVILVGLSRIYLRVHYLSDVLGGMSEGVAWLALCLTATGVLHRKSLLWSKHHRDPEEREDLGWPPRSASPAQRARFQRLSMTFRSFDRTC